MALYFIGLRNGGKKVPTKALSKESPIVLTGHTNWHPSLNFYQTY